MARRNRDYYDDLKRPQLNLKRETRLGIAVVVFLLLAVLIILSLSGSAGKFGEVASQILHLSFGWMAFGVPAVFVLVAIALLRDRKEEKDKDKGDDEDKKVSTHAYVGAVLMILALTGLLHMIKVGSETETAFEVAKAGIGGGYLGVLTSYPLLKLMGFTATLVVIIGAFLVSILITFNISFIGLFSRKPEEEDEDDLKAKSKLKAQALKINNNLDKTGFVKEAVSGSNKALKSEPRVNNNAEGAEEDFKVSMVTTSMDKNWKFPSLDLLDDDKTKVDSGDIQANVEVIQKTLADFDIDVEMGEVNVGPTVTQYTFRPAVGVKLSQIAALQNDLALALAASPVRMELPIPGKALVGIEVPNKANAIVRIREMLASNEFVSNASKLAFSLGRDVAGHPIIADLAKMPHLLIAGATGSGKSVAVNSLLISWLFRSSPSEVKFILIDPKRVELSLYNGVPHLLTPVITDHQQAVNALKWTVMEMDRRYKLLSEVHKRNIGEYNASNVPQHMPYIVVIVDELADLMSVAQKDVEATIVRLAQMARAVGIHLVVATQRPSVDVITGLIKANITSRMAFAVASQVDSRTILDSSGAEKLLGAGDMLYITSDLPKPRRIQGAFVGEKEISKVTGFLKDQAGMVSYNDEIVTRPRTHGGSAVFDSDGDSDELLEEAVDVVKQAGKASASLLQRRLRVGYARAARLLDILEEQGIIGPGDGAKPREVYGVGDSGEDEGYGDNGAVEEESEDSSDDEVDDEAEEFEKAQK